MCNLLFIGQHKELIKVTMCLQRIQHVLIPGYQILPLSLTQIHKVPFCVCV